MLKRSKPTPLANTLFADRSHKITDLRRYIATVREMLMMVHQNLRQDTIAVVSQNDIARRFNIKVDELVEFGRILARRIDRLKRELGLERTGLADTLVNALASLKKDTKPTREQRREERKKAQDPEEQARRRAAYANAKKRWKERRESGQV
ncbi:hypothetical protein HRR83_008604 [Exophiala dermatitidis]|uniref:Uncharacterized protein n=1 Tax=Exophiala dermatitidis TaxID=5970 RepID=A0AAN6IVE4_EXODE|nr:hypothetical protein HRR75_007774 [Exophiala dermatitidis]KAJ4505605.1 hypothetical protein HRR73_008419 [Exophiala dermatitidis]KAJ4506031.1 hypothetical protein HRR74_008461 [Exophiala dermatitidis]KAJ4536591.1 hypothetical protein HRR76_004625 [Exophiala dermatitidis]KAJ4555804.1 hypothetical protein HRR77_001726 [Exophiala dermatitidis]